MTPDERADWLAWRRNGITATDAAAVVGLSPYASPWSLWADKVELYIDDDRDPGPHAAFGTRMEPVLGQWYHDETGLYVVGEQTWAVHPLEPWRRATLDGVAVESPDGERDSAVANVEKKTTTDPVREWERELPVHIRVQCQWQMGVTGAQVTHLPTLHHGFGVEFRVHEVVRDDDDIEWLVDECSRFWHGNVLGGDPPDTDSHAATTAALSGAWTGSSDEVVHADADLRDLYWQLREARTNLSMAEDVVEALTNRMRAALGDRRLLVDGETGVRVLKPRVLVSWNPNNVTRVDTKALRERLPRTAARFSNTTVERKLLVKTPKGYEP